MRIARLASLPVVKSARLSALQARRMQAGKGVKKRPTSVRPRKQLARQINRCNSRSAILSARALHLVLDQSAGASAQLIRLPAWVCSVWTRAKLVLTTSSRCTQRFRPWSAMSQRTRRCKE